MRIERNFLKKVFFLLKSAVEPNQDIALGFFQENLHDLEISLKRSLRIHLIEVKLSSLLGGYSSL